MRFTAIAVLAVFCASCKAFNPSLEPGSTTTIRGSVQEVTGDYVDIRSKSGIVVRVRIEKETKFEARGRDVSPNCATPGTRVAAMAVFEARSWKAAKVLIASGSCTRSDG